jgi:hypothetical protein
MLNNRPLYVGNVRPLVIDDGSEPIPPTPSVPSDMHFMYLANNYDGNKIPNSAINSTISDFLRYENGTLTKVGSGANCYITNGNSYNNYLYTIFSVEDLNLMKADNNTYTYYLRYVVTNNYTGGLICWRNDISPDGNDGYRYMIRCNNTTIQYHTSSGYDTNLSLTQDTVYKVVISGNSCYIVDLNDDSKSYSKTQYFSRNMNRKMTTFWAGYSSEYVTDMHFYGIAGIARATTAEEDELIKTALMNQSL